MKKKSSTRILFITPFSPSSNHAGVVYTRQLLLELSKSCVVDLIYFRNYKEKSFYPQKNINILEEVLIGNFFKMLGVLSVLWVFPIFSARFSWGKYRMIDSLVQNNHYDYIYFDFSQTFAYSLFINHPQKILMAHDVMAQKYSRMKTYFRFWAKWTEKKILKTGIVFTFSDKDCAIISNLYHIQSTPTTFFLSKEVKLAMPTAIGDYFVFFGGWSRSENYEALKWFVQKVNPLIPHIKYKIIGGGLPNSINNLLPPNFEYLGFVVNPYPIIANAKAEIAPLRKGAGVKVKCIDALGCGTPVIGTEVAFEGIPSEFHGFLILAETAKDYVNAIVNNNFNIVDRVMYKNFFLQRYNKKTILKYILGDKVDDV